MRKVCLIVLLAVAVFMFSGYAFAGTFEASDSPWGISQDAGNKWGYEYIQGWLNTNGYGAINAKTGYSLGDSSSLYWGGGETNFRIEMELAGYANTNRLWYYTDATTKANEIFSGADGVGVFEDVVISGPFGLALKTQDCNTWYTYRFFNTKDTTTNAPHALIYTLEAGKKWLVCWEDLKWCAGDKDYNDHLVTVTAVPEPISAGLFLIGGAGLAVLRRTGKRSS